MTDVYWFIWKPFSDSHAATSGAILESFTVLMDNFISPGNETASQSFLEA